MHPLIVRAARAFRQRLTLGPIALHVLATYGSLRAGLAVLAFGLPLALVGLGAALHIPSQHSLSAYYYAFPKGGQCITFPLRTLFTGTLCAICVGLYLYKGFTKFENWLLNTAAVLGLGVAFVPKGIDDELLKSCEILRPISSGESFWPAVHFGSAIIMFVCLGLVAWLCADRTLPYLPSEDQRRAPHFRRMYMLQAACMSGVGILAWALHALGWPYAVIVGEWGGIWAFAWYWALKSKEMALSDAELKAVRDNVRPEAVAESPPHAPSSSDGRASGPVS